MRVLLLSAVLYLLGVALVLFYRPKTMFTNDGSWKEFGMNSPDLTVFPFWLFCVVWGVLSYLTVNLFVSEPTTTAAIVATATTTVASSPDELMPLPPKTKGRNADAIVAEAAAGNMKPGYYVLDKKGSRIAGVPKYVYVGTEPTEEVSRAIETSGGGMEDSDDD